MINVLFTFFIVLFISYLSIILGYEENNSISKLLVLFIVSIVNFLSDLISYFRKKKYIKIKILVKNSIFISLISVFTYSLFLDFEDIPTIHNKIEQYYNNKYIIGFIISLMISIGIPVGKLLNLIFD